MCAEAPRSLAIARRNRPPGDRERLSAPGGDALIGSPSGPDVANRPWAGLGLEHRFRSGAGGRPRGAGMVLAVNLLEPSERKMGINLGSGNIGMAKHQLHAAQIGAVLHHVRGAAMAQAVRAGVRRWLS